MAIKRRKAYVNAISTAEKKHENIVKNKKRKLSSCCYKPVTTDEGNEDEADEYYTLTNENFKNNWLNVRAQLDKKYGIQQPY
jgi:outer membrane protein assembly factor BamD (BamD/ComL family)